ncbi:MAG: WD40 repeat domain-containing protein [Armatimonadota bacterium]
MADAEATAAPTKLRVAWEAQVGVLKDLAFAPGGKYVAGVTADGVITAYTSRGIKCYSLDVPGADRIVLSPDGSFSMAFSQLDRSNATCTFIDSRGRVCWDLNIRGAVWSADSCCTKNGARFVVGTGEKRVYVIDIGAHGKRYKWWTAPGAVVSIAVHPGGESVFLGTWQESFVERRSIDGRCLWSADADRSVLPHVEMLNFSDVVSVRYSPNRRSADGAYELIGKQGQVAFRGTTDSSERTRVLFDPTGKYVCLGCAETIQHKGKSMVEKRTLLRDSSGKQLWEKGSAFFQTDPILVTARGEVLLRDGNNDLFIASSSGRLEPALKLPGKLVRCASSCDGSVSAINCSNGKLYVLKLSR